MIPGHVLIGVGDTVELNCSVLGAPVVYVLWKRNGKPIAYNNRIKLFNEHSLHIRQVTAQDQAMYIK
ncbi:unnamed protein product [Medioppia subpectinata]|uniref:Ig-like domain-containing protein n=1 Tax=Medioppia subpectinata TaxID=1979941 RepID=A0A7R9PYS0_9ACAR|nr:unnamed protein product [Medioppia subpectinata]CAG2105398.1 unnamed protein product [Medioppia subpectinata]